MIPTGRCDNCRLETRRVALLEVATPSGRRLRLAACPECHLQLGGRPPTPARPRSRGPAVARRRPATPRAGGVRRVDPVLAELRVLRRLAEERPPPQTAAELAVRWGLDADDCARAILALAGRGAVAAAVHPGGRFALRLPDR